ncbi:hypothetical protein I4U23_019786 [Adineta vaga]|nr:hypothetical protein I4U23_019786 [Adineta vaga]
MERAIRDLFYLLCRIQITTSFVMKIPKFDAFNSINQAIESQEDIAINGSITIQSTNISSSPSIYQSTTSTETTDTDIWSEFKKHLPIVIAIVCGSAIFVILILCICCYCRRRRRIPYPLESSSARHTEEDIELSTFSSRISRKKPYKRLKTIPQCSYMKLAKEFVDSLGWENIVFDNTYDKCYCIRCYPASLKDVSIAGNAQYVIPRGWTRIGLHVDSVISQQQNIWEEWVVTFHGTTIEAAKLILDHRQFCLPGDTLMDGTVLGIRDGHIPDKKHIYTSPTIAYSSLPYYSKTYDFYSSDTFQNYGVQIVLQCRQKANSFQVQGETVGAGIKRLCPHTPNDEIEYFTEIRQSIIIYGLLLKLIRK